MGKHIKEILKESKYVLVGIIKNAGGKYVVCIGWADQEPFYIPVTMATGEAIADSFNLKVIDHLKKIDG